MIDAATAGEILDLMTYSQVHREYRVRDIQRLIMPPLLLGQAVIVRDGGRIVGLGTYAMLTKEMERRFRGGEDCLSPNDFNSGDRVWVADIIAPFGHVRMVASSMRDMLRARGHERASISFKRLKQGRKPRFSEVTI